MDAVKCAESGCCKGVDPVEPKATHAEFIADPQTHIAHASRPSRIPHTSADPRDAGTTPHKTITTQKFTMQKKFSARRVPRKVEQDDDEPLRESSGGEDSSGRGMRQHHHERFQTSLTLRHSKRYQLTPEGAEANEKRAQVKSRKAKSRISFGTSLVEDDDSEQSGVVTPKRSKLSRIAIQRNAEKRSSLLTSSLPTRQLDDDEDGPSYSAASLQELKDSTPTTPRDLNPDASNSEVEDASNTSKTLDLSSKFGSSLSRYQQPSAIPSAAEIAEKKARRARLAKEQTADEFISLDPSDPELDEDDNVMRDDSGRLVLKPKDKYNQLESRVVQDDEDIMENFDEFTEADGKILLGSKAEAEAARKRKQDMATQIAAAEGASDSDSNASERERNDAFEAAQTRHGTYSSHPTTDPYADARPRTPPKISPLPTLDGVIERLRKQVSDLQSSRMQKLQEMEALQREKIRLGEEEIRIQKALRETAEKFALLRAEKGIAAPAAKEGTPALLDVPMVDRRGESGESAANSDAEQAVAGRSGLGFGMAGRGLESLGASAVGTPAGEQVDEGVSD